MKWFKNNIWGKSKRDLLFCSLHWKLYFLSLPVLCEVHPETFCDWFAENKIEHEHFFVNVFCKLFFIHYYLHSFKRWSEDEYEYHTICFVFFWGGLVVKAIDQMFRKLVENCQAFVQFLRYMVSQLIIFFSATRSD